MRRAKARRRWRRWKGGPGPRWRALPRGAPVFVLCQVVLLQGGPWHSNLHMLNYRMLDQDSTIEHYFLICHEPLPEDASLDWAVHLGVQKRSRNPISKNSLFRRTLTIELSLLEARGTLPEHPPGSKVERGMPMLSRISNNDFFENVAKRTRRP